VKSKAMASFYLALFGVTFAFGQSDNASEATKPNVSANLTIAGLTLGKNTLADATKLGSGKAVRCAKDEEAPKEVCYVPTESDGPKLVLQAGFSGGWKEIDGFKLIGRESNEACYRQCTRSESVSSDITTGGGLRLGLSTQQIRKLLGVPTKASSKKLHFEWRARQKMTEEEVQAQKTVFHTNVTDPFWDVEDTIDILISNGKAVQIEVHRVLSR
jgi:hypothetical protein